MTNLQIAEWAANEYIAHKKVSPDKDEEKIVKYILSTRYKWVNISKEFDELATSNLPYVSTFFDLLITLLNIELEEGRTNELEHLVFTATWHLKRNNYFEQINSTDLNLIRDCLVYIVKYITLKVKDKEEYPVHLFINFKTLIIRRMYRQFKTYNEVESFLDLVY